MRIGLLGGSFNPAHDGHVHISRLAKQRLGLDQVWWLVSPQNPLKPTADMAPLSKRLSAARAACRFPWLQVTDLERHLHSGRTWKTLFLLKQRFPTAQFVWLMGADNLIQIPEWSRWSKIFRSVHVAVFDRSPYSYRAVLGKAARRFAARRLRANQAQALWLSSRPRWVYFALKRHGASSTEIRQSR